MTNLRPLIITALVANLLTFVLYKYVTSSPQGSGMDLAFMFLVMPVVWSITIILAIIIVYIKRNFLLQKSILAWTILNLIFTTPLPAYAFYRLTHPTPETRSNGEMVDTKNGKIYTLETWEVTGTHKKFADKRYTADSIQAALHGDKAYKKDSTWVYFDNNGDTLKLEYYKNDSLVATKQPKTK